MRHKNTNKIVKYAHYWDKILITLIHFTLY